MKLFTTTLFVVILTLASTSLAQKNGHGADVEKRDAIKEAFLTNMAFYKKYAAPKDKLAPVSKRGVNDGVLAGFGGTMVDALTTQIVMNLTDTQDYKDAMEHIKTVDFTTTTEGLRAPGEVSIFELTIRYIGAMISVYQLNGEKQEERYLVEQSQSLADALSVGWYQNNKIPFNAVNLQKKAPENISRDANLAEAGTLTMEWGMLSKYTGNDKYANLATGSVQAILESKPHFPSIWATRIWRQNNTASATYITVGGGCDSFIEYLVKMPVLLGQPDHPFAKVYTSMIEAFQERLVVKTGVKNLTFIADYNIGKNEIAYIHSHLACFIAGNIAYAGRLYERDDWTTLGLELADSCYNTYNSTALGIGPYGFGFFDQNGRAMGWGYVNAARRIYNNKHGFFVNNADWVQGPEVIESVFYAWRITGDPMWRDYAWKMFEQIKLYCATEAGWAAIVNVNDDSSAVYDQTESFLFSEVFKYLYLIFDDPSSYSIDDYVFTTEAHPFKRPRPASSIITPRSPKRASNKRRSATTSFGKVQGQFDYTSIITDANGTPEKSKAPPKPTNKIPPGFFLSQPGESRSTAVKSLCSQTGMPEKVAYAWMSRLPTNEGTTA